MQRGISRSLGAIHDIDEQLVAIEAGLRVFKATKFSLGSLRIFVESLGADVADEPQLWGVLKHECAHLP